MNKLIMPNEVIIPEIGRMVNDGMTVTFKGKGKSMLPFIVGDRDSVVLQKATVLRCGDIVLALTTAHRYVLHRIIGIDGNVITLMGDGNLRGTEQCAETDVLARVITIIRNGHRVDVNDYSERIKSAIWQKLLPVRRWLLAIYRRCR